MINTNQTKHDILKYISYHENASVAELCGEFSLSESTVRRLLKEFEKKGLVERFHGGAHIVKKDILSDTFSGRSREFIVIKRKIAREACNKISDGDSIILLGGTTVFAMCEFLTDKKITVITNSVPVFLKLKDYPDIKLLLLGGLYNYEEMETQGFMTVSDTKRLRADCLFVGAMSITPKQGLTTSDMLSAEQYKACCDISDRVYVLAMASKFKTSGYISLLPLDKITGVITDKSVDLKIKEEFNSSGKELITV